MYEVSGLGVNKGGKWPSGCPTKRWHRARFGREQKGQDPRLAPAARARRRRVAGVGPGRLHLPRVATRGQPWRPIYVGAQANGDGMWGQGKEDRPKPQRLPFPGAKRKMGVAKETLF